MMLSEKTQCAFVKAATYTCQGRNKMPWKCDNCNHRNGDGEEACLSCGEDRPSKKSQTVAALRKGDHGDDRDDSNASHSKKNENDER